MGLPTDGDVESSKKSDECDSKVRHGKTKQDWSDRQSCHLDCRCCATDQLMQSLVAVLHRPSDWVDGVLLDVMPPTACENSPNEGSNRSQCNRKRAPQLASIGVGV